MTAKGSLFLVSAPSGAGKTTLIKYVLERFKTLNYSVSHTTRDPRANEQHGKDYFFISSDEFKEKIDQNHWLEWAKVHDNYYGTSKVVIQQSLEKGENILLDIDVQGAKQIMSSNDDIISIFIMPPSFEELTHRLTSRGTDTDIVIKKRLENAKIEMAQKKLYQHIIINDDLDTAVKELCTIFDERIESVHE